GLITEREFFTKDFRMHLPTFVSMLGSTDFILGGGKTLPYVADQITRTKAQDIMNRKIKFAKPNMTTDALAKLFAESGQNPIPVTDDSNRLLGIVSRSDLIKLLSNEPVKFESPLSDRPVDERLSYVHNDLASRFAMVAKARANVWVTTATVLLIAGFIAG